MSSCRTDTVHESASADSCSVFRSDMEAVQNLRTAIYSFKLRVEAADEGSKKREKLFDQALNYLYRCAVSTLQHLYSSLN